MKKLMIKLLVACLVISILPLSAFAAYTVPDYAVTLNASEDRIYEGESVDITFNVNTDDFLMADMSISYETESFTCAGDTTGIIEFDVPEIIGAGSANSAGGYDLATKYTFTAKDVTDTVEVEFDIESADIVYSYESARDDVDTNVVNRTGTSVVIVKRYDVTFEENGTPLSTQKIEKGLNAEFDTALQVPSVSYDAYVGAGLDSAYYEHVWTYNGNEYTDAEIANFGQGAGYPEITEDTRFVLVVRPQTFDVTVPAESFDTTATPDEATYGEAYEGKINPSQYDDKYDYTVKYEIDGTTKEVACNGDSFTIPGENIIGDMTLSYEKELNITIKAYEYFTGHFLITVDGAATGYTFDGHNMYKSENHDNLRAWIYNPGLNPGESMTTAEAEAIVEDMIFTSATQSETAPAGYDINESGVVDISDAALAHGAYTAGLQPLESWVKEYLSADVDKSYHVDTDDYDMVVEEYKRG